MVKFLGGYNGQILYVDLTKGKTWAKDVDEATARKFIGGAGFCAKIVWDETSVYTDPFSPENPFIIMADPMTGTITPQARMRVSIAAISPLTGIYGQAHTGGRFGDQLKHACFDGVVVKGRADGPVYVWVNDGNVEIRDAGHLWGKDIYETDEILTKETDKRASTMSISVAGEKLVRYAVPMGDGKLARTPARCGLGAVMGSKKLKSIVVRGTIKPKVYDEEGLKKKATPIIREISKTHKEKIYDGSA